MPPRRRRRRPRAVGSARAAPGASGARAPPTPFGGPLVVRQAVRGGQVIYAQNNDLVVLAPVNPGAQVIADGHVHIYSTLRGRAVAGANGLPGARIFVQKLEAELIAIAARTSWPKRSPPQLRGRAAQVLLENGECRARTALMNFSKTLAPQFPLRGDGAYKKFGNSFDRSFNAIEEATSVQSRRHHFR